MKDCESESHSVMSDSLRPHGLYSLWNCLGQNTGVGSLSLLQGIFPTQGPNPGILHHKQIPCQLSHQGSPWRTVEEVILQRSVAWSNLHFNKTTPTAGGEIIWEEGRLHMAEQVWKHKGAGQADKWGVKCGPSLLPKAWPRAAPLHTGSALSCTKVPCRLSGFGVQERAKGQLVSYCKGRVIVSWTRIEAVTKEKRRWTPGILKRQNGQL